MYRDTATGNLYTDATLETALTATLDDETVQVQALDTNTVTIGAAEFIKLTAGDADVEDNQGMKLLLDGTEGIIYMLNDGVPESTSMSVTDVTPEPQEPNSEEQ